MRSLAPFLAVVALGCAMFGVWMHVSVLDPRNVGWLLLGDDRGVSAIGTAAYLRAGAWPSLREPLLVAPEGSALLFTDSIPLIGFLLKPVARWLPAGGIQLIGAWYLLCTLMQALFAWRLVRRHSTDRLVVWLGAALLAALPVLFNRYGHASLCAQWLILWAIWIFVDRERSRAIGWWPALLGVAAMVHSYLLLMVAAMWGGALLEMLVRRAPRGRLALQVALGLGLVATIAAAHGVLVGGYLSTQSYGSWPVALDAWWNPQNPDYTALLPSTPDRHGLGFEGFQYLGAGLLALVVLALARAIAGRTPPAAGGAELRRLGWPLPGLALLAVVAIGPAPLWRGVPLFAVALPDAAYDWLDPVRAAGRLVWPLTYLLAYAAIAHAARMPRATLVLGAALAVQVVDLTPMLAAVHRTSAAADDRRLYRRTRDPRWAAWIAQSADIAFVPAEPFRDLAVMEEVGWRAVAACRPLRYFYTAREAAATRRRLAGEAAAFARGQLDPTRLYILLGDRPPAGLAARTVWLDGVAVIPPGRAAGPSRCEPARQAQHDR